MTHMVTTPADSFKISTPKTLHHFENIEINYNFDEKDKLYKHFQKELNNYGVPVKLSQSINIDIKITSGFPRKIEFNLKYNDAEYYYDEQLCYISLPNNVYSPEVYITAGKIAKEFAGDLLRDNLPKYINLISEDSSNLPKNISFLEAYEYMYNSELNLGLKNPELPYKDDYITLDKRKGEWIYNEFYESTYSSSFILNLFLLKIEILNNDKWSLFEIKDSS